MDLLLQIESDHLLAILCETPSDIEDMSIFDIALRFHLEKFLEFHRLAPLMLQMWYRVEYLNPKKNFLQTERNFDYIMRLMKSPARFYFSPIGQYIVASVLYIFYVFYLSYITYVTYEMLQLILEGRNYLADVLNYWDICIVIVWTALAIMRFVLPWKGVLSPKYWGISDNETAVDARNKPYTQVYMVLWGVQCVLLWTRIAGILQRIPSTGSLLKTVAKMIQDVANFFLILIVLTTGFVFAMYYIVSTDLSGNCAVNSSLGTFSSVLFYMAQSLIGQQDWTTISSTNSENRPSMPPCFDQDRSRLAEGLLLLYAVLGTIMLLNLLIAMMATTFNSTTENAKIEMNFSRIKNTFELSHKNAIMPPPFNMIVLVCMVVVILIDYGIRWCTGGWYVLCAKTFYPLDYSLKQQLIRIRGLADEPNRTSSK
ncbi:hypothetical protein RFI_20427, partial [Reticulomyxa filosa]